MKAKKYISAVIAVILLVVLDQWTKQLVVTHLKGQPAIPLIKDVFELQYLENRGAAFGIFQNRQWMFILLTVIIMAAVIYLFVKLPAGKHYLPLNLISVFIIAGAIGNLIDRVANQFVVDFFYFKLIDFPIFNVADIYVTCAAIAFLIFVLFYYKDDDFKFMKKEK